MTQHRNYKDEHGFMLETSRDWVVNPDNGMGDAVGRTVMAAIAYDEADFVNAFQSCFWWDTEDNWYGMRHINSERDDMSRDHVAYWMVGLHYFNPESTWCAMNVPKRISWKFKQTLDMRLFANVIGRGKKLDVFKYWAWTGFVMRLYSAAIKLACKVGKFKTVHYKDFRATRKDELTRRQRWGRSIMSFCPGYTVYQLAWMTTCLKDTWYRERLQKRVLSLIEPTNYLIRMLMGDHFSAEDRKEIENWSGTDANRWGARLDESTSVDLFPLTGEQPPYNLESDLLKKCLRDYY